MFRAKDNHSVYYSADIGLWNGTARILKFSKNTSTGSLSVVSVGTEYDLPEPNKRNFHLRVEAVGSSITFFIDEKLACIADDNSSLSGHFGLNVCGVTAIFQNLNYTTVNSARAKLSSLEINGVSLSPRFNPNIFKYKSAVGFETESI